MFLAHGVQFECGVNHGYHGHLFVLVIETDSLDKADQFYGIEFFVYLGKVVVGVELRDHFIVTVAGYNLVPPFTVLRVGCFDHRIVLDFGL